MLICRILQSKVTLKTKHQEGLNLGVAACIHKRRITPRSASTETVTRTALARSKMTRLLSGQLLSGQLLSGCPSRLLNSSTALASRLSSR